MKLNELILTSSLLLTLAACNGGDGGSDEKKAEDTAQIELGGDLVPNPEPTPDDDHSDEDDGQEVPKPPVVDDGIPSAAKTFKVNVKYVNFTAAQKVKYEKAIAIVKRVVASKDFMDKVLNHRYGGKKTYVDNNGKSNQQIYDNILAGNESLQNSKNNAMDVEVELYYSNNSTVGYTYTNSKRIWVNTKFFNSYSPAKVAGNLFHEWLHKIGYGHAVSYSTSRDYSVPYAIGYMISTIGSTL